MKSAGQPRTSARDGNDLAGKAVSIGAVAAGVVVLITCIALVLSPTRGGDRAGLSYLGPQPAKSGHSSHSKGGSGSKHGKHRKGGGDSDDSSGGAEDHSDGDSASGDSSSGGSSSDGSSSDNSSSGSSSSDGGGSSSGGSTDSSEPGTSSVSGNVLGGLPDTGLGSGPSSGGPNVAAPSSGGSSGGSTGTATSLSCAKVVTDLASMQTALATYPGQVICMQSQEPGQSQTPSQTQPGNNLGGTVGSTLGNSAGNATDGLDNTANDLGKSVSGAASKVLTGAPKQTVLHTTGYSWQDNQGGNNATISCGVIHKTAGGDGTYDNPTTAAVPGHDGKGAQIPCGTRIYVPKYQKYFIVEDTGATKYTDADHIDIYVDGEGTTAAASQKCMDPVTTDGKPPVPAIINPPPGEHVLPGPITTKDGKCNVADAGGNSSGGD